MRLLWKVLFEILLVVGAITVWWHTSFPTASYRYRLTISVEVDGKVHSGSSVIDVRYRFNPHWAAALSNGVQYNVGVKGQAVIIDLGTRGTLVAALHSGTGSGHIGVNADYLMGRAVLSFPGRNASGFPVTRENVRTISQIEGTAELTPDNLPLLIWFPELNNSAAPQIVTPAEFANVIGDQTRLVSAHVAITNDPILINLDKRIAWYKALKEENGTLKLDGILLGYTAFIDNGTTQ